MGYLEQYESAKAASGDAILLFRMGDFYELFHDDAKTTTRELGLTLTSLDKGENPIPMAGFPYHQLDSYIAKLVSNGHRVAVCEQVDPKQAKPAEREITRVIHGDGLVRSETMTTKKASTKTAAATKKSSKKAAPKASTKKASAKKATPKKAATKKAAPKANVNGELRPNQLKMLKAIASRKVATIKDVIAKTGIGGGLSAAINTADDSLVNRGYVKRELTPEGERLMKFSVTAAGRDAIKKSK